MINVESIEETAFNEQSLYFMLMYAWRMWPGGAIAPAVTSNLKTPSDLLAKLLTDALKRACSAGLQRDYISIQEETVLPTGRILLQKTLKNRSQRRLALFVERDTFSVNCLANRAIREAIKVLLSFPHQAENRVALEDSLSRLSGVDDAVIDQRDIQAELFKARRRDYRISLSIALTLKRSEVLAPSNAGELAAIKPLISDETMLRSLFETFLREFYRHHLSDRYVGGRRYSWGNQGADIFPVMQTDTNIESDKSVLVIDAKCTPKVVSKRKDFTKLTLNSSHLYQMFSYMSHCGASNPNKSVRGMLIYPKYAFSVDETSETPAGPLRVKTIDFHRGWDEISDDLLQIVFD